jgi:pyruvate dehydrogenase E2 component (dihydrolipoamide acetyltransferase)
MTDFLMPSLGADMDAGKLLEWLKHPGDTLKRGDIIAVVETQKGAIEIEVFHDGVLERAVARPGDTLPVGAPLAVIRTEGEAIESPRPAPVPPPASEVAPQPSPRPAAPEMPASVFSKITPAARRAAAQKGIGVSTLVPATDGIIGLREIPAEAPTLRQKPGLNLVEMRKAIGAAMARSKREIPHYYVSSTFDLTAMMDWLAAENARRPVPERLLPAVPVIKAFALGLASTPELNGWFVDGALARSPQVKMGIGIAMRGGGLIAPAIDAVERLSLDEIMGRLTDLVARVRSGRLRSSELTGASVTLSNLGDDSADALLPVIYPPQVAIIGIGQIADRPWIVGGAVAVRKLCTVSVAGDHRANDGRGAARFLKTVERLLQKPEAL